MDDRYQLPSATSLSLPAKISPEIRATIFYPVSTDASSRRSKPVLFAIRSSAFLLSRFRFPNYRRKISQFTSERANPLLEEYYFAGRIQPSLSPFLLLFTNIHRSILVYSFAERNTKISTRSRDRVERFVSLRLPRCPR